MQFTSMMIQGESYLGKTKSAEESDTTMSCKGLTKRLIQLNQDIR